MQGWQKLLDCLLLR